MQYWIPFQSECRLHPLRATNPPRDRPILLLSISRQSQSCFVRCWQILILVIWDCMHHEHIPIIHMYRDWVFNSWSMSEKGSKSCRHSIGPVPVCLSWDFWSWASVATSLVGVSYDTKYSPTPSHPPLERECMCGLSAACGWGPVRTNTNKR